MFLLITFIQIYHVTYVLVIDKLENVTRNVSKRHTYQNASILGIHALPRLPLFTIDNHGQTIVECAQLWFSSVVAMVDHFMLYK